jgi:hypothetical protein
MVCNDGSQTSIDALQTIYHGLMRPQDHLVVANAWSFEKESYLPYNMKKDFIKNMAGSSCAGLGDRY